MQHAPSQILIVGSGINSLVCAALLALKGKTVRVLERNERVGGCMRSEELFPGFTKLRRKPRPSEAVAKRFCAAASLCRHWWSN